MRCFDTMATGAMIATLGMLLAVPAAAQQTTIYAYDALGRLTTAGPDNTTTTSYVFDDAGNRKATRCCEAVGGWQVREDGFDPYFYVQTYPDIRLAGVDPYQHWLQFGAAEGRWPNRFFDTSWYRSTYGIAAGKNPLSDYHQAGWQAGRDPSPGFSTTAYHAAYPDTGSIDPLQHYLRLGYGERRSAFPVQ